MEKQPSIASIEPLADYSTSMNHNNSVAKVTNVPSNNEPTSQNGFWKYREDEILKYVTEYISSTYHSHYTSDKSTTQVMDLIESIGDAEAFSRSNAIKYLSRFGKKNGKSKLDLLKAIHYCVLLYYFSDLYSTNNEYPNY